MIHIPSKYSIILLGLLGIIFFIGNYCDESVQTIDYESYLFIDQPIQPKESFIRNSNYNQNTVLLGLLNQLINPLLLFPDFIELKFYCFLTSTSGEPFHLGNPPLLI